jgi:hypothetical protein
LENTDTFRIHVFKLEGETVIYIKAKSIADAQQSALQKAKDLVFSPSRAPYMAIAFDGLEEVDTRQEEIEE